MREYLVFTLRGPMQSWGTVSAVGEVRATAGRPGRSGVMGLVAAALGIRRDAPDALETLHGAARIAVRADASGERMIDYHTVQTPPSVRKVTYHTRRDELVNKVCKEQLTTILSRREYLAGAAFTVCVWLEKDAGYGVDDMRDALARPRLALYLGRKSCPPGFPLLPEILSADNVAEAFERYDEICGEHCRNAGSLFTGSQVWSDAGHGVPEVEKYSTVYSVRDVLTNSARRQFAMRQEHHFTLRRKPEVEHVHE
ncbi:CRISPR system Cascade subunit CasD [Paucidesulfovibrio gracilis DSM 16080]|uniref:CRISPR system Cascade subunit CasD n=1 Tax=Paucidesulfovibrio gracilis DSM 16080 TaxID=1121449 RepID=A0A1T4XXN5_9BACT|nr:type I-E CRISPR-associated protein Cas5/CasD [Paucidesulfovibrio gracilis]SKA93781.1 CRISPR system Cascade subunit CasD [Paucidesulfovibrio gracilis DSM 16080]